MAVALEDPNYEISEMVYDLANLRAGHRFRSWAKTESRLSILCRQAFGFRDCAGYLRGGLPTEYGKEQLILFVSVPCLKMKRKKKRIWDQGTSNGWLWSGRACLI